MNYNDMSYSQMIFRFNDRKTTEEEKEELMNRLHKSYEYSKLFLKSKFPLNKDKVKFLTMINDYSLMGFYIQFCFGKSKHRDGYRIREYPHWKAIFNLLISEDYIVSEFPLSHNDAVKLYPVAHVLYKLCKVGVFVKEDIELIYNKYKFSIRKIVLSWSGDEIFNYYKAFSEILDELDLREFASQLDYRDNAAKILSYVKLPEDKRDYVDSIRVLNKLIM